MTPLDDVDVAEGCEPVPLTEFALEEGLFAIVWSSGAITFRWVPEGGPNTDERELHVARMIAWHERCSGKYLLQ